MGSINIIDSSLVSTIKWNGNSDTFDVELHSLNTEYDEFIILNPMFENWILDHIDTSLSSTSCLMWTQGDKWIAKKFKREWTPAAGWKIIECSIDKQNVVNEYNNDLPLHLFNDTSYKIKFEDYKLKHVWYLDPKYSDDRIWVKVTAVRNNLPGIKHMGYLTPNIVEELDVVFISYNEPNAEANWKRVLQKCPFAKRVDGVKGIFEAHKAAAQLAETDMFYVVDGDAELLDDFYFTYQPNIWNRDTVHVWNSINPINDLKYGYGGVKLFPKHIVDSATTWKVDMTTGLSHKLKVMNRVSNITAFNTDPFGTWRSAFRECAKLSTTTIKNQIEEETDERLSRWCSSYGRERKFGDYAIAGARAGRKYGLENRNDLEALKLINNREWLKEKFNETA